MIESFISCQLIAIMALGVDSMRRVGEFDGQKMNGNMVGENSLKNTNKNVSADIRASYH